MSKYEEVRSRGPRLTIRYPEFAAGMQALADQQDQHFVLVKALCGTQGPGKSTRLFDVDFVLLSVINRSLDLISGFRWSYDQWNLSTAAPIVRMQVDNLLRLALLAKAPPNSIAKTLLSGKALRKEADPLASPGKKHTLTDQRLREHARDRFPWIDLVYEKASGWVHFSSVHVGVSMQVTEDRKVFGRFPSDINRYPREFLEQVLWAMRQATSGLVEIVEGFARGKSHAAARWEPDC